MQFRLMAFVLSDGERKIEVGRCTKNHTTFVCSEHLRTLLSDDEPPVFQEWNEELTGGQDCCVNAPDLPKMHAFATLPRQWWFPCCTLRSASGRDGTGESKFIFMGKIAVRALV